jgi:hypothetical protein
MDRDKTDFCRCLEVIINEVRGMKQRHSRPASLGPEMLQVSVELERVSTHARMPHARTAAQRAE